MSLSRKGVIQLKDAILVIFSLLVSIPLWGDTLTLRGYLNEVESRNPEIRSLYENFQGKRELEATSFWPGNPMFTWNKMFRKEAVGIKQTLPFPVKLLKRKEVSERRTDLAYSNFYKRKTAVMTEAKSIFFEYTFIRKAIEVTKENLSNLKEIKEVAKRKHETGGPLWSVLRVDVEIAKLENKLSVLMAKEKAKRAELNALRDRPVTQSVDLVSLPEMSRDLLPDSNRLVELALNKNPLLRVRMAKLEVEKSKLSLLKWGFFPDFSAEVLQDKVIGTKYSFGIKFPLWFPIKEVPEVKAHERFLKREKYAYKNMENEVLSKVESFMMAVESRWIEYSNYRDVIVPRSLEAFKVAESSYMAGAIGFLDLLNSENQYLDAEIALWKSYMDLGKSIAKLEEVVGEEVIMGGE